MAVAFSLGQGRFAVRPGPARRAFARTRGDATQAVRAHPPSLGRAPSLPRSARPSPGSPPLRTSRSRLRLPGGRRHVRRRAVLVLPRKAGEGWMGGKASGAWGTGPGENLGPWTGLSVAHKAESPHLSAWAFAENGAPYGIRTRVLALRGPRPGPLDEGSWKLPQAAPVGRPACKASGTCAAC